MSFHVVCSNVLTRHRATMKFKTATFLCFTLLSCASAHSPHGEQHKFGDQKEVNDVEHIKQHLQDQIDVNATEMNDKQRQFHFFKMHDLNKDNMIDGCELIKAMVHDHSGDAGAEGRPLPQPIMDDSTLENTVDTLLMSLDINNDGFIDYAEFARTQKT